MDKKIVSLMILFSILMCTSVSLLRFKVAKASGTIYIMADGSVDPPTAPIQHTGNTYTFTSEIYEPIIVKRDYIIIDGAGFTVQGAGNGKGIDISGRNYVTIKNANIKTFSTGVHLYQLSSHNSITGNNITNCSLASLLDYDANFNSFSNNNLEGSILLNQVSNNNKIYGNNFINGSILLDMVSNNNNISKNNITGSVSIGYSRYNAIVENNITTPEYATGISLMSSSNNSILRNTFSDGGLWATDSYGNLVENNSINGKPLVYLENLSNYTVDNAGQVILVNCQNMVVQNLNLSHAGFGIQLQGTNYTEISNNNVANNSDIELRHSSNNSIYDNNLTDNSGIDLWNSANNSISANNITNNGLGICFMNSANNSISANNITSNVNGVQLDLDSSYNTIFGNNIKANTNFGIILESKSNKVLHNNFAENQKHVSTDGFYGNLWDDGVEGNFWSNYTGVDDDQDGIGDSPHVIDAENQDNHPLMGQFSSFNTSKGCLVNVVSNSTVEDFRFFQSNSTIRMHVSNTTANQTFGFCRVCIPHVLINETYVVTVNDAEPYNVNYTLYDDGSNRWIYFSYQHSTLEIIIIPESLWLIPSLLIATTPILIMISRRKHSA